jgi:hypothetical protein
MSAEPDSRTDSEGERETHRGGAAKAGHEKHAFADEPRKTEEDRLLAAKSVIERVLGRRGGEHWAAFEFELERDREIACLEQWARVSGCWLELELPERWGSSETFGEHDIVQKEHCIWKATKPQNRTGKLRFCVYPSCLRRGMADPVDQLKQQSGTPYQYLTRLELLNRWCSGPSVAGGMALTRLEGFAKVAGRFSIITSQPFFQRDRHLDDASLSNWLRGLGFQSVTTGIWYDPDMNLALFDVKPANVILCQGVVIPVDVIPIEPQGHMRDALNQAVAH